MESSSLQLPVSLAPPGVPIPPHQMAPLEINRSWKCCLARRTVLHLAPIYSHMSPLTSEGNTQFITGHQNRVLGTHKMLLTKAV